MMPSGAWVHVRDIADAHVKVIEASFGSGKEFLLSGPNLSWEDAIKFIEANYPGFSCKLQPPFEGGWKVDVAAANQVLGIKWRPQQTVIKDVITQQLLFQEKGIQI